MQPEPAAAETQTINLPADGEAIIDVFARYGLRVHAMKRHQWPDGVTQCDRVSGRRGGRWFLHTGPVDCEACLRKALP